MSLGHENSQDFYVADLRISSLANEISPAHITKANLLSKSIIINANHIYKIPALQLFREVFGKHLGNNSLAILIHDSHVNFCHSNMSCLLSPVDTFPILAFLIIRSHLILPTIHYIFKPSS